MDGDDIWDKTTYIKRWLGQHLALNMVKYLYVMFGIGDNIIILFVAFYGTQHCVHTCMLEVYFSISPYCVYVRPDHEHV